MRIVQVTLRFDAPGGVETNVRETARRLRAAGDDVRVFASDLYDEGRWEVRSGWAPEVDGVPVRRFPVRKRVIPGLTMPMMIGLMDGLSESAPELVHAHSHRYGHVLEAAAVAERRGIPLVVSTHYHPADARDPAGKRALLRLQDVGFGATAYRVARAVIVETEHEAALVREFAPPERLRVVPPGIDLREWATPERDPPKPAELPTSYVLFVGRVAPNKGLPTLLEALARIPAPLRHPLVIMGPDWGERGALEHRARALGLADQVRFLGLVPDAGAYRAIVRGALALVLPSRYEAFGLVLLEAMAAATPIVASAVGGVPEALDGGRRGRLVPPGDPAALAAALESLEGDPATTARLRAAASDGVRGYDWSSTVGRLREVYREAVGG